eukprot:CAMPEP_0196658982 /NCGR_PEP_ID=MMETSP1086-20130531/32592_1 /TAXON_ID=77921 /ORGANISM="Cyanoptyche  gloeocystis , Strain SAG4.97" /LENGTH=65 /DNA_ID=CAMNT_0041992791 /DNA_START=62 /DNA_END=256 /DNA_ORIENTATION=+
MSIYNIRDTLFAADDNVGRKTIWPLVVKTLRQDNRIKEIEDFSRGTPEACLEWACEVPPNANELD